MICFDIKQHGVHFLSAKAFRWHNSGAKGFVVTRAYFANMVTIDIGYVFSAFS